MITVVCWNIAGHHKPWEELLEMDADVALLQEAGYPPPKRIDPPPPKRIADRVNIGSIDHWRNANYDVFPMVVQLSDRVNVDWYTPVSPARVSTGEVKNVNESELAVSDVTTIAAARITPRDAEPFIAVSMYARWLGYHPVAHDKRGRRSKMHSDASMHRIISDLSVFIRHHDPSTHRILLAGDMNAFYGAAYEQGYGKPYREASAFDRLASLGLEFLGPQSPNGQPSRPGLVDMSVGPETKNVPTFRTNKNDPESAKNQLDYVFASRGFHESIRTYALNRIDEWGSSDHCRILIEIDE